MRSDNLNFVSLDSILRLVLTFIDKNVTLLKDKPAKVTSKVIYVIFSDFTDF